MRYKKQYLKSLGKRRMNRFSDIQYETMIDLLESATIIKGEHQVKIKLPDGGAAKLDSLLRQWQDKTHAIENNIKECEINRSDTLLVYKCDTRALNDVVYNSVTKVLFQGHIHSYGEDERGIFIICDDGSKYHLASNLNYSEDDSGQESYDDGEDGSSATGSVPSGSGATGDVPSGNGNPSTPSSPTVNGAAVPEPSFFESNKTIIIILVAAVAVAGFIIFRK